jgi:hypothetical protein
MGCWWLRLIVSVDGVDAERSSAPHLSIHETRAVQCTALHMRPHSSRISKRKVLTSPVNVHPGTSKCTPTSGLSFRSQLRCSASVLTAALLALYAGFPGGFVMPCLLPVMTMAAGFAEESRERKDGAYVFRPLMTPKRLVLRIWKVLGQLSGFAMKGASFAVC